MAMRYFLPLLFAILIAYSGSSHADTYVCYTWSSEIRAYDPSPKCICINHPGENHHTGSVLDWTCNETAQGVELCSHPCSGSSVQDKYTWCCDQTWCPNQCPREWYDVAESCSVCVGT